jgi:hypothetical protein
VYALSAVQDANGIKYLCVGGYFGFFNYGGQNYSAHNIVLINLNSGTVSKMQVYGGSAYGTDGPVYAIKGVQWYNGFIGAGVRLVVGGYFGSPSRSIAVWSQQAAYSSWYGFDGGLNNDGSTVYGLEATTTNDISGQTAFQGIWMTGMLSRTINTNIALNIAKLSGSTTSWTCLGRAFQHGAPDANCTWTLETYTGYIGHTVCRVGTNIYFGGWADGHQKADGSLLSCFDCAPCSGGCYPGVIRVGTNSVAIDKDCLVADPYALVAFGNDMYATGMIWYDYNQYQEVWFAKYFDNVRLR